MFLFVYKILEGGKEDSSNPHTHKREPRSINKEPKEREINSQSPA